MFERIRKLMGGLKLGSGDRDTVRALKSSDELAREILEIAQNEAKNAPTRAQVTCILEENQDVDQVELMRNLKLYASIYGLEVVMQHDNAQTFRKV